MLRVSSYRNCAKADCNAHSSPRPYEKEVPPEIEELRQSHGELLSCVHCDTVWVENRTLEGQTCYIVRQHALGDRLNRPVVQHYKLKRPRKTLNPRRFR